MRMRPTSVRLTGVSVALLSIVGTLRTEGAPQSQLLAVFGQPASLSRLNAITLERDPLALGIGEYHFSSSVSPDGNTLALATGGPGGGLQIVDLPSLTTRHRVPTSIAAEAVAWLTPTIVVAGLQCVAVNRPGSGCAVVAVDAAQGKIIRRWPADKNDGTTLGFGVSSEPKPILQTPYGVVLVLGNQTDLAPAVLALVTPNLELRKMTLDRIIISASSWVGPTVLRRASERKCAVIGPDGTIADVDLQEMTVRYYDVLADRIREGTGRQETWVAGAIDGARTFVYGVPRSSTRAKYPANQHLGVMWLDTSSWKIGVLDSEAAYARSSGGKVFVYGGRVGGLRAYALDGTRLFQVLESETFSEPHAFVHAMDDLLHVVTREATTGGYRIRALSPASGKVLTDGRGSGQIVQLISVRQAN